MKLTIHYLAVLGCLAMNKFYKLRSLIIVSIILKELVTKTICVYNGLELYSRNSLTKREIGEIICFDSILVCWDVSSWLWHEASGRRLLLFVDCCYIVIWWLVGISEFEQAEWQKAFGAEALLPQLTRQEILNMRTMIQYNCEKQAVRLYNQ